MGFFLSLPPRDAAHVAGALREMVRGPPVVPGAAVKGLLRSRAEFIMRSVGITPPPCEAGACGSCWKCEVFGHGGGADRFTGGVLDGALYTTEVLEGGSFAIEAALLPGEAGGRRREEIAAVLRLVLEDVNYGIIGMGGGTARGYGSVRVEFGASSGGLPSAADARRKLAEMVRGGA